LRSDIYIMIELNYKYKSYKEVCLAKGEKYNSGEAKQNQLEEWEMQYKFVREGNGYIFTEIIDLDAKRESKQGKSTSELTSLIRECIVSNWLEFADNKESDVIKETVTNIGLSERVGLINKNYGTCKRNKNATYNYLQDENLFQNNESLMDVIGDIRCKIKDTIRKSLETFSKMNFLVFKDIYMIEYSNEEYGIDRYVQSNKLEYEVIEECKKALLKKYGYESEGEINGDKKIKDFYAELDDILEVRIDGFRSCYKAYSIEIDTSYCKEHYGKVRKVRKLKKMINELYCKQIIETRRKSQYTLEEAMSLERKTGLISGNKSKLNKYNENRLSFTYIDNCKKSIDLLINIGCKDISRMITRYDSENRFKNYPNWRDRFGTTEEFDKLLDIGTVGIKLSDELEDFFDSL